MTNTTIQLSHETKKMISSFGTKGESFETIIRRLYERAVKDQARQFLMSSENCIPIEEAIKEAERRWPKSK